MESKISSTETQVKSLDGGGTAIKKTSQNAFFGKRHFLMLLCFIGIINIYTMRINLSMAIVAMVAQNSSAVLILQSSENNATGNMDECPSSSTTEDNVSEKPDGKFQWDSKMQGNILGAYFYGYIATQMIGGWIAKRFGGKYPFGLGILLSGIMTLLTPLSANYHYGLVFALRVLEGLSTGICYPAMQHILAQWSPNLERTRISTIVNAGAPVGNIVVLSLSGIIADQLGWESIFYIFGGVACFWFIFWQLFIHDSPHKHPTISHGELKLIAECKRTTHTEKEKSERKVPWKNILTSFSVWAMVIAHFGQNWGNYTLLTNLPTYMSKILKFNLSENGIFSALPYLGLWIMGVSSGYISDFLRKRHLMSTTNVRKLFNTLGNLVPTVALVLVPYVGCDYISAITLLTIATGFSGFTQSSYQVNSIDLSPAFASVIFGFSNTIANVPGIVSPYTIGLILQGPNGQTIANWKTIFYISGAIRLATSIFYAIFASGEIASWDHEGEPVGIQ